jgi:hypothetical protein
MYDIWDTDTLPTIKKTGKIPVKKFLFKALMLQLFSYLCLPKKVTVVDGKLVNTDVFSHRPKKRDEHQSVLPL